MEKKFFQNEFFRFVMCSTNGPLQFHFAHSPIEICCWTIRHHWTGLEATLDILPVVRFFENLTRYRLCHRPHYIKEELILKNSLFKGNMQKNRRLKAIIMHCI